MQSDEFMFPWEKDEKFKRLEQVESEYDEGVWQQTVKLYEEAINKQPDHPEYLFHYGYLMQLKAKRLLREAARCYQKGLESELIKSDHSWISGKLHAQLINVRGQLSENYKSVEFYKKRLKQSPDDPQNYCFLAQCYLNADQVDEAKKVIKAGAKLFPDYATLAYYEGETESRLGHTEEALQAWEKSAMLDPQLIDGRFSRAFLLEREQRLEESAHEWTLIIEFMNKYNFNDDFPKRELRRIEQLASAGPI